MKILVTGATGHLGNAVVETLLKGITAQQIVVIVRTEDTLLKMQSKGLQTFMGNYDDVDSLEDAMNGVDTVLLISSTDEGNRMQQHRNVVDSAKKMGVSNIAYTSRSLKDKTSLSNQLMLEHFDTEDYIKESGLNYTIFRNALYMDVLPLFVGKQGFETGIFQPAGDGKVAFALRAEMGEAMANVLMNEECENKIYRFTGTKAYSFYDVAEVLTELSHNDVKYNSIEIPEFEKLMKMKGLPDSVVKKIIDFNKDIKNGQESTVSNDLENKLGRKPINLFDGLNILFPFDIHNV